MAVSVFVAVSDATPCGPGKYEIRLPTLRRDQEVVKAIKAIQAEHHGAQRASWSMEDDVSV